ncbi:toprim domain-containing protein [Tyzzerella sp. OttesenSCG-928-J15]|nr:toprim domain-containing protein [Tyzzerella sp. OttesenSCG-928-J15]
MPGVSKEQVEAARQVDLLSWLQQNEPGNLRKVGGEYCLRDHDSLKISNGKWNWHSRGIGGHSALDFLIKVRDMDFVSAVEALCDGRALPVPVIPPPFRTETEPRSFILPAAAPNNDRVTAYLQSRGLGKELIDRCISAGVLYQSKQYSNAVFVGKGRDGEARFACARGTLNSSFKRDVAGSDKRFGFHLPAETPAGNGTLAVFESPIDTLSHLELLGGDCHRLSLAGTAHTALMHFLEEAHEHGEPDIRHIALCLDNDAPGITAAAGIKYLLEQDSRFTHIEVTHQPSPLGKDYNDALLATQRAVRKQLERDCHSDGGPVL